MARFEIDATYSDTVEADTFGEAMAIFLWRMEEDVRHSVLKAGDIRDVFFVECVGMEADTEPMDDGTLAADQEWLDSAYGADDVATPIDAGEGW